MLIFTHDVSIFRNEINEYIFGPEFNSRYN